MVTLAATSVASPDAGPEEAKAPERDTPTSIAAPAKAVPDVIRRRLLPFDARRDPWSWAVTGLIVAIAAVVRFVGLSHPPGKIFDETYYAKDAYGLLTKGVEWNYKDNVASYVVHPPLGKWLIAIGEWMFGYQDADGNVRAAGHLWTAAPELGWRFSAAVAGTISVLVMVRIARRMFGSTTLGAAAGLLLALDGFHLVLSRTAILDIFLLLFILAAFGALVADRDARRRRWLTAMENGLDPTRLGRAGRLGFAFPWWRLAAAVLFGCSVSVKWSALFFLPAFLILILWWEYGTRRTVGARHPIRDTFLDEFGWIVMFIGVALVVYLASWSGWFLTDDGFYRHWLADNNRPEPPVIGALHNLLHYHQEALKFHEGLDTKHTYQSWPWQWLLLGRPVAFYWSNTGTCGTDSCASEVLLLGTPVLWWSFLPALAALVWLGIARRDWRAGAILLMVFFGLIPWFYFAIDNGRTMFSFYTAPALPFMILAVVYALGAIMSPATRALPSADSVRRLADRRLVGGVVAGAYLVLVVLCFGYFYKVFVGDAMPYADWAARMWLGSRWI
ncbi:phospholipid carrier-dependent glycosyltransferase [Asanoa ferruginea]|nr:phospholipid carrier-dependent glycosyltransferase [Asanoa ferruginea]